MVTLQDLFVAYPPSEEEGIANRLLAPLRSSGLKPNFLERLAAKTTSYLSPSIFSGDGFPTRCERRSPHRASSGATNEARARRRLRRLRGARPVCGGGAAP